MDLGIYFILDVEMNYRNSIVFYIEGRSRKFLEEIMDVNVFNFRLDNYLLSMIIIVYIIREDWKFYI